MHDKSVRQLDTGKFYVHDNIQGHFDIVNVYCVLRTQIQMAQNYHILEAK